MLERIKWHDRKKKNSIWKDVHQFFSHFIHCGFAHFHYQQNSVSYKVVVFIILACQMNGVELVHRLDQALCHPCRLESDRSQSPMLPLSGWSPIPIWWAWFGAVRAQSWPGWWWCKATEPHPGVWELDEDGVGPESLILAQQSWCGTLHCPTLPGSDFRLLTTSTEMTTLFQATNIDMFKPI